MTDTEDDKIVNNPTHYTSSKGVECIDITEKFNFNMGNSIKYIWRAGLKEYPNKSLDESKIIDLKKALWYIEREIKRCEIK